MQEDKCIEKIIKERISKEKMSFPEKLDDRIKTVIRDMPERKRSKLDFKKCAMAAALIAVICAASVIYHNYDKEKTKVAINDKQPESRGKVVDKDELIKKLKSEGYIVEKSAEAASNTTAAPKYRARYYASLEELVDDSDVVIEGEVLAVRYFDKESVTYKESKVLVTKSFNDKAKTGEVLTFCESGYFLSEYSMKKKVYQTSEEEERAKNTKVFCHYGGHPIMQPGDNVILFGKLLKNFLKDSKENCYFPIGDGEGKLIWQEIFPIGRKIP